MSSVGSLFCASLPVMSQTNSIKPTMYFDDLLRNLGSNSLFSQSNSFLLDVSFSRRRLAIHSVGSRDCLHGKPVSVAFPVTYQGKGKLPLFLPEGLLIFGCAR